MDKLELRHLAPYLPYGLKIHWSKPDYTLTGGNISATVADQRNPILRPLSDLTKEIEHNGEKFAPILQMFDDKNKKKVDKCGIELVYLDKEKTIPMGKVARAYDKRGRVIYAMFLEPHLNRAEWNVWEKLFEYHFDVFGLIEAGLAIDINFVNIKNLQNA